MVKRYKSGLIFICLLPLFYINTVHAFDINKYEELKRTSMKYLKTHINTIGETYSWSNIFLVQRGDKAFYCTPSELGLNASNYMDIIDKEIAKSKKDLNGAPIELVLFVGLVETFPCPKQK